MIDVKVRFKGYVPERLPSGAVRHRVRVEGQPKKRMVIPVGPEDPTFSEHYYAARAGRVHEVTRAPEPVRNSFDALIAGYLAHLELKVDAGLLSPSTLRQRTSLLTRARDIQSPDGDRMGDLHQELPPEALEHIRDSWGGRTAQADNCTKALRGAFTWAKIRPNPANEVSYIHRSRGGAVPWSSGDLRKFLEHHPEGSVPRLWLLLALFTAARRSDLVLLGRRHEVERHGIVWLDFQPGKKGSAFVSIPMLPQLHEATRTMKVQGPTYLLERLGPALRQRQRCSGTRCRSGRPRPDCRRAARTACGRRSPPCSPNSAARPARSAPSSPTRRPKRRRSTPSERTARRWPRTPCRWSRE